MEIETVSDLANVIADWIGDCLGWVIENIGDLWDND